MSKDSLLFLFAAICALEALVAISSWAAQILPHMKPMWWAIIGILACLILSGWGFYRSLHMIPGFESGAKQEAINDKEFINQEVLIDGKHFDNCRFENVTFVIKGEKGYGITHCRFAGQIVIKPDNPMFTCLIALQKGIGMLPRDTKFIGDNVLRNVESPPLPTPPSPTPVTGTQEQK